jgi:hypothetical protein
LDTTPNEVIGRIGPRVKREYDLQGT